MLFILQFAFMPLTMLPSARLAAPRVISATIVEVDEARNTVRAIEAATEQEALFQVQQSARIRWNGDSVKLSDIKPPVGARLVTGNAGRIRSIIIDTKDSDTEAVAANSPTNSPGGGSATTVSTSATIADADWNQFRGPGRMNISTETGLADRWPSSGPPLLLTASSLGEGYSAVSIVGDIVCTMGNVGDEERIIALDRLTGEIIWSTRSGDAYREGQGNGPRGTPTVVNGRVYSLGAQGDLTCCELSNGDVHWRTNILRAFGGSNIVWGISESVLLHDNKVICTPGGSHGSVVALNAQDGETVWYSRIPGQPQASYASPVVATIGGVTQYIVFTSKGVAGIRASDGQPMWGQDASSNGTANCATPLVIQNNVFSSSDYGTGAELIELQSRRGTTISRRVYHTRDMKNHHGGMIHRDGFVYGSSGDIFSCVELRTGKASWRQRSMKGAPVLADDKIIFRNEKGEVVLLEATPDQLTVLGRFDQPQRSNRPAWTHPVVAGGRLYLRDQDKLLVYDVAAR